MKERGVKVTVVNEGGHRTIRWRGPHAGLLWSSLMGVSHCVCVCLSLSGEGYWVGKASLRSWRQLALEQLEEDEHETKHSNGQTNGQGPHKGRYPSGSTLI